MFEFLLCFDRFHVACASGQIKIVDQLLQYGAEPNVLTIQGKCQGLVSCNGTLTHEHAVLVLISEYIYIEKSTDSSIMTIEETSTIFTLKWKPLNAQ